MYICIDSCLYVYVYMCMYKSTAKVGKLLPLALNYTARKVGRIIVPGAHERVKEVHDVQ